MIIKDARPLLIVWLPIKESLGADFGFMQDKIGVSFIDDGVDFVLRRLGDAKARKISEVPIPFYFYERLTETKENPDNATGFLLDSCEENIDLAYPDLPTTQSDSTNDAIKGVAEAINGNNNNETSAETYIVKNTLDISFRVKTASTVLSILRALLKRVLTNASYLVGLRFSFYFRDYLMSYAKCVDYNESPITGTDLIMIKIKLQNYNNSVDSEKTKKADKTDEPLPHNSEVYKVIVENQGGINVL